MDFRDKMHYLPNTRVIGGKRYRFWGDFLTREQAKREREKLVKKGNYARIYRVRGLYGVYYRKTSENGKKKKT